MFGKFGSYISETNQELKKVTWPSRAELLQATTVVIVTSLIVGAFIGVTDMILSTIMRIFLG